jgi:transaldolase/glucose-6-phosphate isomerase
LIVSTKFGGTLEPNVFKEYFFEQVRRIVGEKDAGGWFIAITDPGCRPLRLRERSLVRVCPT